MNRKIKESKRIVITGITRGLGRAMAERFAELGHTVAGCGRSHPAIKELGAVLGESHHVVAIDVTHDQAVKAWAHDVVARFGPPDLLINNAAVINRNAALWDVPVDEFDRVIDINIKGVVNVIRHFVPPMIARGCGVIVNFSSGWGRSTSPEVAPYCATKWAIEGLTRALAQELPRGLAAIPLNPGIIDTAMLRSCFGPEAGEYKGPATWAQTAVPFLLALGPDQNGKPMTVG